MPYLIDLYFTEVNNELFIYIFRKFDKIAGSFIDPRVWWWKNTLCGEPTSYREVYLSKDKQKMYKR
jgi:hypothetical protein